MCGLFGGSKPKSNPAPEAPAPPAPPPPRSPQAPALDGEGLDSTNESNRVAGNRRGRNSLRIDLAAPASTGLQIPT